MLKISVKQEGTENRPVLEVEGRLAGPWVDELERCWEQQQRNTTGVGILVRLSNVSFVDESGTELLRKIFGAGAKLEGNGCMVRALIARITAASANCGGGSAKTVSMQSGVGAKGE
jgi:anti-anti-sigma regulatory factor